MKVKELEFDNELETICFLSISKSGKVMMKEYVKNNLPKEYYNIEVMEYNYEDDGRCLEIWIMNI